MNMNQFSLFLVALFLGGCAIPQPGGYGGSAVYGGLGTKRSFVRQAAPQASQQYIDEALEIATEPPGARILVNDAAVGVSPLRYTVRRLWRGQPGNMTLDTVKIEALPTAAGQCVQSGIFGEASRKVASPVSFTMAACAQQPARK
jgi:hypothetical protein